MNIILIKGLYLSPIGLSIAATLFCEEIWKQNTAESLLIRTKAIAYMEVGKGRKQDAEALSASDSLSFASRFSTKSVFN